MLTTGLKHKDYCNQCGGKLKYSPQVVYFTNNRHCKDFPIFECIVCNRMFLTEMSYYAYQQIINYRPCRQKTDYTYEEYLHEVLQGRNSLWTFT